MPALEHLIYASVATQNFEASQLTELLQKARAANERCGLTGMLLHVDSDGSFFQALEGETEAIDQLLEKLLLDKRHSHLTTIVRAIDGICFELGIDVIAEGVETEAEYAWLTSQGIHLFQGYLFAKPAFEWFPPVYYPER